MATPIPASPRVLHGPDAEAAARDAMGETRHAIERTPPRHDDELLFSNPVSAPDSIRFRLAAPGATRIELTALSGRHALVLIDAPLRAGWHAIELPPVIPPGTYFTRMRTAAGRTTAMMVVTR